jgi:hypothetical protein
MKNFIALLISVLCASCALAQNMADGISLRSMGADRERFYYGEPASFAFELKNNTALLKQYWKKATGVNIYYKLIDVKTNEEVGNSEHDWKSFRRMAYKFYEPPAENYAFPPDFAYYFIVNLTDDLYSPLFEKYTQGLKYHNTLSLALATLPEGEYKLMVEFFLMPGDQKIEAEHRFRIDPLPEEEQEAYQAFLASTVYAANSYYPGDNNYLPSSERSYKTFLEKYSESLFAEYASYILIDKVYHYGGTTTIPQDVRQRTVKKYITEKDFTRSNLRVKKVIKLPHVVGWAKGIDKRAAIEAHLLKLKEEDPLISVQLIRESEQAYQMEGLRNRALEERE